MVFWANNEPAMYISGQKGPANIYLPWVFSGGLTGHAGGQSQIHFKYSVPFFTKGKLPQPDTQESAEVVDLNGDPAEGMDTLSQTLHLTFQSAGRNNLNLIDM